MFLGNALYLSVVIVCLIPEARLRNRGTGLNNPLVGRRCFEMAISHLFNVDYFTIDGSQ